MRKHICEPGEDIGLTTYQLAARWGVTPGHLRNRRVGGRAPAFFKVGKSVRYRMSDVLKFEAATLRTSTTETP